MQCAPSACSVIDRESFNCSFSWSTKPTKVQHFTHSFCSSFLTLLSQLSQLLLQVSSRFIYVFSAWCHSEAKSFACCGKPQEVIKRTELLKQLAPDLCLWFHFGHHQVKPTWNNLFNLFLNICFYFSCSCLQNTFHYFSALYWPLFLFSPLVCFLLL